jgi:hypothetical protein
MRILSVKASCFVHATEEEERVRQALLGIFPGRVELRRSEAKGQFGNPIVILEAELSRQREIRAFLKKLLGELPAEEVGRLRSELEQRFERGRFYIRLDKMHACRGRLRLGQGIQVVLTVTSYPYSEEEIKSALRRLLGG